MVWGASAAVACRSSVRVGPCGGPWVQRRGYEVSAAAAWGEGVGGSLLRRGRERVLVLGARAGRVVCRATGGELGQVRAMGVNLGKRVGFVGCGMMAEAMIKGFMGAGVCSADQLCACDVYAPRLDFVRKTYGIEMFQEDATNAGAQAVAQRSDIVFIAVKPQQVRDALAALAGSAGPDVLVVSIAAGVTLAALEAGLTASARVVRVMPNTPCMVGETAAAFALGKTARPEDGKVVESLFSAVGEALQVEERYMDYVTGLSGSGPAYVYIMIEAMADGGVRAGLPRAVALRLAAQTVLGSARMVKESGLHPGELKDNVCSPGGTTIAGVHELEKAGFRAALINAVTAAADRATQLSKL